MIEFRQLSYFKTIVDCGSLTGAAQKLHVAQPALTKTLQQLEGILGQNLIERSTRHFKLTPAGKLFYERSLQMLELLEVTKAELEELESGSSGLIRIGTIGSEMELMLPKLMASFVGEFPSVSFKCHEASSLEVIEHLKMGLIDLGFVRSPVVTDAFYCHEFPSEPMVAANLYEKKWLKKERLQWQDLKEDKLIIHNRYAEEIIEACGAKGFKPQLIATVEDTRSLLLMAQTGMGTAIVQKDWLGMIETDFHFRAIEAPKLETQTLLLWQKSRNIPAVSLKFIEYCKNNIKTIK